MRCFEKLVKSKFLANVSAELQLARQTVKSMSHFNLAPSFASSRKLRKDIYNIYAYQYYLIEEIVASLQEYPDDKLMLYYFQAGHAVFIYSQSRKQVDEALLYTYNRNGDIPYYRGRHVIDGKTVHTVFIDTRMSFTPISPN